MTLTEKAYLVVDDGTTEGVFELKIGLEETSTLEKQYIMSNRGQFITAVYEEIFGSDNAPDLEGVERRRGYHIDGGAGDWEEQLEFQTGLEDVTWGDGSADPERDASGPDVHPVTRKQVMEYWISRTRTDSSNPGKLYYGEWTDGRFEGTSGAFGRPMNVSIRDFSISAPELREDVNTMEGQITVTRTALFPESITDRIDEVRDVLGGITIR